jgi:hypothetical protein
MALELELRKSSITCGGPKNWPPAPEEAPRRRRD